MVSICVGTTLHIEEKELVKKKVHAAVLGAAGTGFQHLDSTSSLQKLALWIHMPTLNSFGHYYVLPIHFHLRDAKAQGISFILSSVDCVLHLLDHPERVLEVGVEVLHVVLLVQDVSHESTNHLLIRF